MIALISQFFGGVRYSADAGVHARPAHATNDTATVALSLYASGLNEPVGIANSGIPGDERLFIVEKEGAIRIIQPGGILQSVPFLQIDSRVKSYEGERGLLGLAFDPDYASNGFFYVNYTTAEDTADEDVGDTRISRFSVPPNTPNLADPNSEIIVLKLPQPHETHNGGDLLFGPDGYLYIPTGDGGYDGEPTDQAQDGSSLLGKILRIDVSTVTATTGYAVPPDNPFVGQGGVQDEIWAMGLRNPWRASFDRETGDLYLGDVGQSTFEEIDFQPAASTGGENYGWRCYEGMSPFNTSGCGPAANYEFPIFVYSHSIGRTVIGGYAYRGTNYPDLTGHYFFANFGSIFDSARLWSLYWDGSAWQTVDWGSYPGRRLTSFGEDIHGELYLADMVNGHILKLLAAKLFLPAVFQSN